MFDVAEPNILGWVFDYRIPLQSDDALDSLDVHSIQLSSAPIFIIILFHSKN